MRSHGRFTKAVCWDEALVIKERASERERERESNKKRERERGEKNVRHQTAHDMPSKRPRNPGTESCLIMSRKSVKRGVLTN